MEEEGGGERRSIGCVGGGGEGNGGGGGRVRQESPTLAEAGVSHLPPCPPIPFSTFGVAAISGNWNDHWVFWFGPYLGAIAAALAYNYL